MSYGKGYRPDAPDPRDYKAALLFAGSPMATLPDVVSWRDQVARVRDQGATSTCVAQAFAAAIEIRAHIQGHPLPRLSERAIYVNGQHPPLLDEGLDPRAAARGLSLWGVCAEERWPWDEHHVTQELPPDVVRASVADVPAFYRVSPSADSICEAIAHGYPVPFGQQVDRSFEDYSSGVLDGTLDKPLGGHMTTIVGYDRVKGFVEVLNSWSSGWGERGFYRMSFGRLLSVGSDFYALTVAPGGVQ